MSNSQSDLGLEPGPSPSKPEKKSITIQEVDLEATAMVLCDRIKTRLQHNSTLPDRPKPDRMLITLAGVPGSGKSSVASAIVQALPRFGINDAVFVPLEGFLLSKSQLARVSEKPLDCMEQRGAPFSFNSGAVLVLDLVASLRIGPVTEVPDPNKAIMVPSFDYGAQDPVEKDILIPSSTRVVIIEGSFILLDDHPWSRVQNMVDDKWYVHVPEATAKQRMFEGNRLTLLEDTEEAAFVRGKINNRSNDVLIRSKLILPDVIIIN